MNILTSLLTIVVSSNAGPAALDLNYSSLDWRGYIRRDMVPYHRLVPSDFRSRDDGGGSFLAYTTGFIEYSCKTQTSSRDPFRARVVQFKVWSGLDRNRTWRKSSVVTTAELLAHEQGHLDINEITAYEFASTPLSSFPVGSGRNPREAESDLRRQVDRMFQSVMESSRRMQDAYDRDTRGGLDGAMQARWSAEIVRRMNQLGVALKWVTKP